ncbi:MAG: 1-deoxy-D-xylulose-5-phosphate reductoisomerase [Syntrophobacterales bacterium]|nr:1-deoxy-D-xylulose-5-phosphate reductoisomerase [Syntrophobacterales bacterium]
MKNIAILGSTGSIGRQSLAVIDGHRDRFAVNALAAGKNVVLLREQISRYRPRVAAVCDEEHARKLKELLGRDAGTDILCGPEGYRELAVDRENHLVLSAMVGAAGLLPTMAAVEAGRDIALANKETLVMAGELVMAMASARGVRILPVDSEHSAIFQCLQGNSRGAIRRIILTASGGPFRTWSPEALAGVTAAQALRHPNWEMGRKITIDSATMMNKGLEIIEARWLFDVTPERIDVVVHPQSIVHSLVEYCDGSVLAQLARPDMRLPIAYAFSWPERLVDSTPGLDLTTLAALEFQPPDTIKFPCLSLAGEALRIGGTMPAALNGANEVAVQAFLDGQIPFPGIPGVIAAVMEAHRVVDHPDLDAILAADFEARETAKKTIKEKTAW